MPKDGRPFKLNIHDYAKGWAPFCRAVGRPDLIDDPRFATIEVRVKNMPELIAIFDEIIAQQDLDYWIKTLTEHISRFPRSQVMKTLPSILRWKQQMYSWTWIIRGSDIFAR